MRDDRQVLDVLPGESEEGDQAAHPEADPDQVEDHGVDRDVMIAGAGGMTGVALRDDGDQCAGQQYGGPARVQNDPGEHGDECRDDGGDQRAADAVQDGDAADHPVRRDRLTDRLAQGVGQDQRDERESGDRPHGRRQ